MESEKAVTMSTEESIKKDNKKAGWKFALFLLLSGIVGGIIGFLSGMASKGIPELTEAFNGFMTANMPTIELLIPIVMVVSFVPILIWCILSIRSCKKEATVFIETDDEEGIEKLELKLSHTLLGTSVLLILYFLLYSIMIFSNYKYSSVPMSEAVLIVSIVFMVGIILIIVLQQKIVDCIRLMNPEKQGSVYDMNFNKKWETSCDEAEKQIIYKAGYKAYKAVNMTCMILWVIFMIMGINTGVGFMSVMTIIIIWTVLVCVYIYNAIKYSK